MVKKNERNSRRAIAEQLRKEQQRKERRRSLLILGACIIVVLGLLGSASYVYWQDQKERKEAAGTPLAELGVSESAAACQEIKAEEVDLPVQKDGTYHVPIGSTVDYPDAPPAFGYHWANFLQGSELRTFYTPDDRPEVQRLVHSLEHGHTILWYDDTVKPGSDAYKTLQAIADKFDTYFIAAPWQASDGDSFPSGQHLALTHWTGPENQQGITQYCAAPSGAVVKKFTDDYEAENSPEPGAV